MMSLGQYNRNVAQLQINYMYTSYDTDFSNVIWFILRHALKCKG